MTDISLIQKANSRDSKEPRLPGDAINTYDDALRAATPSVQLTGCAIQKARFPEGSDFLTATIGHFATCHFKRPNHQHHHIRPYLKAVLDLATMVHRTAATINCIMYPLFG